MAASILTVDLLPFGLTGLLTCIVNSGGLSCSIWKWKCLLLAKKGIFYVLWNYRCVYCICSSLSISSHASRALETLQTGLFKMQGQKQSVEMFHISTSTSFWTCTLLFSTSALLFSCSSWIVGCESSRQRSTHCPSFNAVVTLLLQSSSILLPLLFLPGLNRAGQHLEKKDNLRLNSMKKER